MDFTITLRAKGTLISEPLQDAIFQDVGKGGLSLRGVAFMMVLAVLAVLESTLPSFCFSYKIQYREAAVTVSTVLAVSAVVAVSVVTATPLKLNPLSRDPEFFPREKGKTAFSKRVFLRKSHLFPFSHGKNRISQGVENRLENPNLLKQGG